MRSITQGFSFKQENVTPRRIERFWSNVNRKSQDDCWIWLKTKTPLGYGKTHINGKHIYAHRLAFAMEKGSIPEGMEVCHRCDNPSCVNPAHLFLATHKENMIDREIKGRGRSSPFRLPFSVIREIVLFYLRGFASQTDLAKFYGLKPSTISRYVSGQKMGLSYNSFLRSIKGELK